MDNVPRQPVHLAAGPLAPSDLQCLAQVVSMQAAHRVLDPISCGVAKWLPELCGLVRAQRNFSAATAPAYGSSLRDAPRAAQLVMSDSVGDIAVLSLQPPLSLVGMQQFMQCAPCVCIKLCDTVLHHLPLDILHWLQQLQQQRRLQVVLGYVPSSLVPSSLVPTACVCVWLCVFCSPAVREAVVFPHQRSATMLSVVVDLC